MFVTQQRLTQSRSSYEAHPTTREHYVMRCRTGKRPAEFAGHMMRKIKLEYLVMTGKTEGKGSRGRQTIYNLKQST